MPGRCLRGAVIEVDLNPVVGHEQAKIRPCVVVQNDISNARSHTTIVAPITGAEHVRKLSPTQVAVPAGEAGLIKNSVVMCEQIRTVDERRIVRGIGHLPTCYLPKLDRALKVSLGLYD